MHARLNNCAAGIQPPWTLTNVLCVALLAARLACAQVPAGELHAAVPPGQEGRLAEMLGQDTQLPDGCSFTGGRAAGRVVSATYRCRDVEIAIELRHPSQASAGALQTANFAIEVVSGRAPADLLGTLEARIRAREAAFEWTWAQEPPRPPWGAIAGLIFGSTAVLVVMAWALRRAAATRTHSSPTAPAPRAAAWLAVALAGVLCLALHGTLHATGALFVAVLRRAPRADLLAPGARFVILGLASIVAIGLLSRVASRRWQQVCALGLVVTYFAIGHWRSRLPDDLHYLGTLSTSPPSHAWSSQNPDGTRTANRTNQQGFREPEFAARKPDGVIRVALLGDSYVFGIGVNGDGTLRAHVAEELARRWPATRFEVLNLGIPGNNLASHVELFAIAAPQFDLDATVVCLTLPNDLSQWDEEVARRDARRLGLFSFVRFLVGDGAQALWALAYLERSVTPDGLVHLDRQMQRLDEARRRSPSTEVVALFSFSPWDPAIADRLRQMSDVTVVSDGPVMREDFIPDDGHPTSIGNRRSAARITAALSSDPRWRALLERAS